MTLPIAQPKTPVISRSGGVFTNEYQHESWSPKGSVKGHEREYTRNIPLEFGQPDAVPGSNLPVPLQREVLKRNCFVVHSD